MNRKEQPPKVGHPDEKRSERYEAPSIRVFTEEEIVAQLGPAQLYTGGLPFQF